MRLKQGLIELPPGIDIAEFVQHDGKPPAPATPVSASRKTLTLATLRDRYLATRARGREKNTLYTDRIHFKHLVATLGEKFPLEGLGQADLQRHVERRAKASSISASHDQEGNHHASDRLALGRPHGLAVGRLPE